MLVTMRLEAEGGPAIDAPTLEQVTDCLRRVRTLEASYAILEQEPGSYIQAAPDGDGMFVLGFQQGSLDRHFRVPRSVAFEEVIAAFQSYLH